MDPVVGLAPLPTSPRKQGEETSIPAISPILEETSILSISPKRAETSIPSIFPKRGETSVPFTCRKREETSIPSISRKRADASVSCKREEAGVVPVPRRHLRPRLRSLPRCAGEGWGGGAAAATSPTRSAR